MSIKRFPFTLNQLTYFVECARTLNMTQASSNLHVAQSAVSTAITQLEKSLGSTLFIRQQSKGLILTDAGEKLLNDTNELFAMLSGTVETIQNKQSVVSGEITIACFNTLAPFLVPELLSDLEARFPDLKVQVLEGDENEILNLLRQGKAELGIHYSFGTVDGIHNELVGFAPPHAVVSTKHRLAGAKSVALKDLADDPFILLDMPSSREYFLAVLEESGLKAKVAHRSGSYETVRSLVAKNLGYSILNQKPRIKKTYGGERVVSLEINHEVRGLDIVVSSLAQIERSARAKAVFEGVRAVLAKPIEQD